jgi:hypothetical protein
MSEPNGRPPDVPPLLWGILGVLVIVAFVLVLGVLRGG